MNLATETIEEEESNSFGFWKENWSRALRIPIRIDFLAHMKVQASVAPYFTLNIFNNFVWFWKSKYFFLEFFQRRDESAFFERNDRELHKLNDSHRDNQPTIASSDISPQGAQPDGCRPLWRSFFPDGSSEVQWHLVTIFPIL